MPETKKTKRTVRPSEPRRPRARKSTADDGPSEYNPTEHDIASRAYQLFIERGGEHGRDLDDWLMAKRELLSPGR